MALSETQRKAAEALLQGRPAVMPGTRAIVNDDERRMWYGQVSRTMVNHGLIDPQDIAEFRDAAGVAD